jgi:hypothetical protein
VFRKTEDIPEDKTETIVLKVKDILPEGIESIIPSDLGSDVSLATQKEFIKGLLTDDIVDAVVRSNFDGESTETVKTVSLNFENRAVFSQFFDELKLPVDEYVFELKEVISESFFTGIKSDIDKEGEKIWFSPELEVYDLNLSGEMKVDIVNENLSGNATINTVIDISKNEFGVNTRNLIEDYFILGKKKNFQFNSDSEWILIALINKPELMYLSGDIGLEIDLSAYKVEINGTYDADITITLKIEVNDAKNPISSGYSWQIEALNVEKFRFHDLNINGFELDEELFEISFRTIGTISVKLK